MTDPRMTPTNDAPVTVNIEDRWLYLALRPLWLVSEREGIMAGKSDLQPYMQLIARHRLAALASAPAGDGVEDRYSAGYSQGTIDADQQHQWMQDKAWQDAVLMLVHYSTIAERTWLVGHEDAARKLAEWWGHARALADTKSADDIAALARPRAAVGEREARVMVEKLRELEALPDGSMRKCSTAIREWSAEAATMIECLALQSPPAKVEG